MNFETEKLLLSSVICFRVSCSTTQVSYLSARRPTNQALKSQDSKYASQGWDCVLHPVRQQPHRVTTLSTRSSPCRLLLTGCHGDPNPPSVGFLLVPGPCTIYRPRFLSMIARSIYSCYTNRALSCVLLGYMLGKFEFEFESVFACI